MKPTKHATTNYKKLLPYLENMNPHRQSAGRPTEYRKFAAPGMMDLVIESLHYDFAPDMPVFSLACYGEQNGDLMRDPDLVIAVHFGLGRVEPLSYQNDYLGIYQEVWNIDRQNRPYSYRARLRADLDEFLWTWLDQIAAAGYEPKKREA